MPLVEKFPKKTFSRADVEKERDERIKSGATSSVITQDSENWILTTVFPAVGLGKE